MHTVMVIGGGLVLLALFVLVGRQLGGGRSDAAATAAAWFIPIWLIAAAINLWFGVPAAIAAVFWWRFGRGA